MSQGIDKNREFQCWSCHQVKTIPQGISLDESEETHVCDSCWNKIPNHWKLITKRWFMGNTSQPDIVSLIAVKLLKEHEN